jgi:hypothetical protein
MSDLAKLIGQHGAALEDVSSGPFTQKRGDRSITLWVTKACIDCDQSRENCPAIYRRAEPSGTAIDAEADFFAHAFEAKQALDTCPVNALGMKVE